MVQTQPTDQYCIVENHDGTVSSQNVDDVAVTCGFSVGGEVDNLSGTGLTLLINGEDSLVVVGSGNNVPFTFATPLDDETGYTVSIDSHPSGQTCSFDGGSETGTIAGANVTSVQLTCSP